MEPRNKASWILNGIPGVKVQMIRILDQMIFFNFQAYGQFFERPLTHSNPTYENELGMSKGNFYPYCKIIAVHACEGIKGSGSSHKLMQRCETYGYTLICIKVRLQNRTK